VILCIENKVQTKIESFKQKTFFITKGVDNGKVYKGVNLCMPCELWTSLDARDLKLQPL